MVKRYATLDEMYYDPMEVRTAPQPAFSARWPVS